MSAHASGFAAHLDRFVAWRKASGVWNDHATAEGLLYFDRHCAGIDPTAEAPTREMIDSWCQVRPTENASSNYCRTLVARQFCDWARTRGIPAAEPPELPKPERDDYVPHAFTEDELRRFFEACDSIVPYMGRFESRVRKVQLPAFFRLLYSSGLRTTEARLLSRSDVDLRHELVDVRRSKGYDQHYVALHPNMAAVLEAYDEAAERLQPGREWFFESPRGRRPHDRNWVIDNFNKLWREANGDPDGVVAYDLRHNYAIENIMSWEGDPFDQYDRLHRLSKSMGHRHISSTLYYFSIVPALHDKLLRLTEGPMGDVMPDVWEV